MKLCALCLFSKQTYIPTAQAQSLMEIQVMLRALSWGKPKERTQLPHMLNVKQDDCLGGVSFLAFTLQKSLDSPLTYLSPLLSHHTLQNEANDSLVGLALLLAVLQRLLVLPLGNILKEFQKVSFWQLHQTYAALKGAVPVL